MMDTDQDTALSIIMTKDFFSLSMERYDKFFSLNDRLVFAIVHQEKLYRSFIVAIYQHHSTIGRGQKMRFALVVWITLTTRTC